jgi:hypothetical protein
MLAGWPGLVKKQVLLRKLGFAAEEGTEGLRPACLTQVRIATRISCTLPYPTSACAAFIEESRIKSANATQLHRKFGGTWGTPTELWEKDFLFCGEMGSLAAVAEEGT